MATDKKPQGKPQPLAPFSQEAEEAVIASCLIDPAQFEIIRGSLRADDFFLLRHQIIWQAMVDVVNAEMPLDAITLAERLENGGHLETLGGRAHLLKLMNSVGTSIHAEVYAQMVERTRVRRDLMGIADEMKVLAQDELGMVDEVIAYASQKLTEIRIGGDAAELSLMHDTISEHMDIIEKRRQNPDAMIGWGSGYRVLDMILRGFQPARLYVVAGRPGMGKSAFMGNLALRAAKHGAVAWFSFEMTRHELTTRWVAQMADIDSQVVESGTMTPDQWARYTKAAGDLDKLPIYASDRTVSPMMIRAAIRRLHYRTPLTAIFVDYLQLVPSDEIFNNRVNEVGYVARILKEIAMELKIPVIAAAQLNRAPDNRLNHRPLLSDLRESGDIEQSADVVMFAYSDHYYDDDLRADDFWEMELIVAKQRSGSTGLAKLGFRRSRTEFVNLAPRGMQP